MQPTLLILAAGMGSRYGGLKQMDTFGPSGETIIDYSIYDAIRAGFGKIVFVIRQDIEEEFKSTFIDKLSDKIKIEYVFQELNNVPEGVEIPADRVKPWGTGHAVMVAAPKIQEPFAMINADDFYGADAFKVMGDFLASLGEDQQDIYSLLGYQLKNTLSDNGSVSRGICEANEEGYLQTITERTKIEKSASGIFYEEGEEKVTLEEDAVTSMNFIGFTPAVFDYCQQFFKEFLADRGKELKSEFYIPSVLNRQITEDTAKVKLLHTTAKWFGVTYREDREVVIENIKRLVAEGVYPEKLWE